MEIKPCYDVTLLAELQKDVQNYHHQLDPTRFKPYEQAGVTAMIQKSLANNTAFFVAYLEDRPVGYVACSERPAGENAIMRVEKQLEIEALSVKPAYQGQGHGTQLMNFMTKFAKEQGYQQINLNYWTKNPRAAAFYQRLGYETVRNYCELTL